MEEAPRGAPLLFFEQEVWGKELSEGAGEAVGAVHATAHEEAIDVHEARDVLLRPEAAHGQTDALEERFGVVKLVHESARVHQRGGLAVRAAHRPACTAVHG